jgi:transketolase
MSLWRPCDETETVVAWKCAVERNDGPTTLVLSRQGLIHQVRTESQVKAIERGAYVLHECNGEAQAILIGTGSEVEVAMQAAHQLSERGVEVRVVSMPSADRFEAQPQEYRDEVLPPTVLQRVAIEAGHTGYWYKWVGHEGAIIGIDTFGESAPGDELFREFGITPERVVSEVERII